MEKHYWLFGEQYHLLTSAEPDFNEALRRLLYAKTGSSEFVTKEMDIFMNKQNRTSGIHSVSSATRKRREWPARSAVTSWARWWGL